MSEIVFQQIYKFKSAKHVYRSSRPPWPGTVLQGGSEELVSSPQEVRGTVVGVQGWSESPLERAKFSKNGIQLECHAKKLYGWKSSHEFVSREVRRTAAGGPLWGVRGGAESVSSGVRFLRTDIIYCHGGRMFFTNV